MRNNSTPLKVAIASLSVSALLVTHVSSEQRHTGGGNVACSLLGWMAVLGLGKEDSFKVLVCLHSCLFF
jgi:hypothetical protein